MGYIQEKREVQDVERRQLKNDVVLSTINLTYYQETEATLRPEEPFYTPIARSLTDGFWPAGKAPIGVFYFLTPAIVGVFGFGSSCAGDENGSPSK